MERCITRSVRVHFTEGQLKCLVFGKIIDEGEEFIAVNVGDSIINVAKQKIVRITPVKPWERFY